MRCLIEYFLALRKLKPPSREEESDATYYFNEFSTYYMPIMRKTAKNLQI